MRVKLAFVFLFINSTKCNSRNNGRKLGDKERRGKVKKFYLKKNPVFSTHSLFLFDSTFD
jgi:hypothetical protein